jgi:hypothetical protein
LGLVFVLGVVPLLVLVLFALPLCLWHRPVGPVLRRQELPFIVGAPQIFCSFICCACVGCRSCLFLMRHHQSVSQFYFTPDYSIM